MKKRTRKTKSTKRKSNKTRKKNWVLRVILIARAVTMAPWVADFGKEEGAVTADETDAQEQFMH